MNFTEQINAIKQTPEEYELAEKKAINETLERNAQSTAADIASEIRGIMLLTAHNGCYITENGKNVIQGCCMFSIEPEWHELRYEMVDIEKYKYERLPMYNNTCINFVHPPENQALPIKQHCIYTDVTIYNYKTGGGFFHNSNETEWFISLTQNVFFDKICEYTKKILLEDNITSESYFAIQKSKCIRRKGRSEDKITKFELVEPSKKIEISKSWAEDVEVAALIKYKFLFE